MSSPGTMTCPVCKKDIFYLDGINPYCSNCGWTENELIERPDIKKISTDEAEKLLNNFGFNVKIDTNKKGMING
jgi:uncharacterized Zn ribbon protein